MKDKRDRKEYKKQYHIANKSKLNTNSVQWRLSHPGYSSIASKKWRDENPEESKRGEQIRAKKRRKEWIELMVKLKSAPCKDCKYSFPHYVMDFDHCYGIKEFQVSNGKGKS